MRTVHGRVTFVVPSLTTNAVVSGPTAALVEAQGQGAGGTGVGHERRVGKAAAEKLVEDEELLSQEGNVANLCDGPVIV